MGGGRLVHGVVHTADTAGCIFSCLQVLEAAEVLFLPDVWGIGSGVPIGVSESFRSLSYRDGAEEFLFYFHHRQYELVLRLCGDGAFRGSGFFLAKRLRRPGTEGWPDFAGALQRSGLRNSGDAGEHQRNRDAGGRDVGFVHAFGRRGGTHAAVLGHSAAAERCVSGHIRSENGIS